jgi:HD-GYP domain-containing protein (c-di-GMP phosphodiesterase class II)
MSGDARSLVVALGGARKAVQLYPPTHPAFGEAMDLLVAVVGEITADGPFALNLHLGRLYDGSVVIPEDVHGIDSVAGTLEERSIESLTFRPSFSRADATGLTEVLSLKPEPDLDVDAELAARSVQGVTITFLARPGGDSEGEGDQQDRVRQKDRAVYHRLLSAMHSISEQLLQGGGPDLSQTTPLVEALLKRMLLDPAAVMGLSTMRAADDAVLIHSLNVMIYTLAVGQKLGLPEEGLGTLGTAALLHDIGKSAFDPYDLMQAEAMRTLHPRVGGEILQKLALEDPAPMLVAYEHHMNIDGTGFPERPADYIAHPYSRIVAIADRFGNLVDPASGIEPLTRDRAVVQILRDAGVTLDPFFSRLFANALGAFPIGSLVRLSDHSVGVVVRLGEDPLAPVARIIYDDRGMEPEERREVDLSMSDVRIVEVVTAESLGIEVSDTL